MNLTSSVQQLWLSPWAMWVQSISNIPAVSLSVLKAHLFNLQVIPHSQQWSKKQMFRTSPSLFSILNLLHLLSNPHITYFPLAWLHLFNRCQTVPELTVRIIQAPWHPNRHRNTLNIFFVLIEKSAAANLKKIQRKIHYDQNCYSRLPLVLCHSGMSYPFRLITTCF